MLSTIFVRCGSNILIYFHPYSIMKLTEFIILLTKYWQPEFHAIILWNIDLSASQLRTGNYKSAAGRVDSGQAYGVSRMCLGNWPSAMCINDAYPDRKPILAVCDLALWLCTCVHDKGPTSWTKREGWSTANYPTYSLTWDDMCKAALSRL